MGSRIYEINAAIGKVNHDVSQTVTTMRGIVSTLGTEEDARAMYGKAMDALRALRSILFEVADDEMASISPATVTGINPVKETLYELEEDLKLVISRLHILKIEVIEDLQLLLQLITRRCAAPAAQE